MTKGTYIYEQIPWGKLMDSFSLFGHDDITSKSLIKINIIFIHYDVLFCEFNITQYAYYTRM